MMNMLLRVSDNLLIKKKKSDKEINSSQPVVVPSPNAVSQWEMKAQQDLAHYERTGKLPEGMFVFD